jgi:D-alanine-D-alanine ligase
MNILLMAGGWSEEREVSLSGARGIMESLGRLGHQACLFDPRNSFDDLWDASRGKDFVFINLHGSPGEDGLPQSLLEHMGLPYQGAGPSASFLALNKSASKAVFRRAGLPVAAGVLLPRHPGADWTPPFPYPLFIKHNTGGSSLRMAKAHDREELAVALDALFTGGGEFLVEPVCPGVEVTCAVLGELEEREGRRRETPQALSPILIRPLRNTGGFFDYASKYAPDGAEELCPAPLPCGVTARIRGLALDAHQALGLRGYSRTDFILGPQDNLTLLETNTLPGMTPTSLLPKAAAAAGLSFDQLVRRLLDLGLAAHCP